MLLETWLAMAGWWRSAFPQERSFLRVLWILLGLLAARGRGTVTSALALFGLTGRWSADFRAFSRSDWDAHACFRGVIHHSAPYLRNQRQIVISLDDTGLPKRSRMIKACSWLRDPLGPRFQTNFVWGLRCLHAIVHLPPQQEGLGATGISVGFELAPPPKKPKAKDGGYTNHTLLQGLPGRMDFIGRVRKDIKRFSPATGKGRKVYGERLPTPEAFRADPTLLERFTTCFYGGKNRDIRFKDLSGILWRQGGQRRKLRLIIVMPTPYRPPGARKLKYDQPAYLITTDLITSAQALIQAYLDRWEIEVLHRELKSQVGLGQAQVWSDKSVPRLHPALVAAYALLKLAAMKAFGPTRTADYHERPPWRSRRDKEGVRKPSANDLLTRLRADLAAQVHGKPPDGTLHPRETYSAA